MPWCDSVLHNSSLEQFFCIFVHLFSHPSASHQLMDNFVEMDMSPLRPPNYLFSCELKKDKMITLRWVMITISPSYLEE